MQVQLQKWGNSLALRVPKHVVQQLKLQQESVLDVVVEDGKLMFIPASPKTPSLDELIAQMTPENIHQETDFGNSVGNEADL